MTTGSQSAVPAPGLAAHLAAAAQP